jgi:DNA-binding CsgD family transcriptional regulator
MEPLLEREDELAALDEAARRGGFFVLVGGEAGIGKTTLVRALRERLRGEREVVVGACEPLSVPVPLGPLRELAELPDGGDPLALARHLLDHLDAKVAVVEDAHWADPTTLDVLRVLARRLEGTNVAVVVTYRDDEVAANPPLERLLGDLATSPSVRRLRLRPLSDAAVRELAAPAGVDPERLAQVTGGNPFLVVESLAAGDRLPASVRAATLARAGRLDPAARDVVAAAAAIGGRVPPLLLERVAPGSAPGVEEALARGVLVADGPMLGFRHELIRAAIESSLSPPRRLELHRRVVAALADERPPDHARLAHHAELAGLDAEACRYAARAAEDAERVGALRETSLQAARALRLGSALDGAERIELLLRHSHAANFANLRLEDAVESADEAIELAVRLGDRVREGRARVARAAALWSLAREREAREAAERAVEVLEGTGDLDALARAHAARIRMEATSFDPRAALELAPQALALATDAGLEETRVAVEISRRLALGHLGDPTAPDLLAAVAAEARERGFVIQTVRAYVNLVHTAAALRRHDVVDAAEPEAQEVFDEYQTTIPAHAVELYRALSLLDRGRWEEARAAGTRRDRRWAGEAPFALMLHGLVDARRGEPGAADLLERAWSEVAQTPDGFRRGAIRVACVEAAWLAGDSAAARRHLRERSPSFHARTGSDLALWAFRYGIELEPPEHAPEPVLLELAGDWRAAIEGWRVLDAPYEAALAALPGDERAARAAVDELHRLGGDAAARAFARDRGGKAPRGPRRSTRAHPAGLTRREQEVLDCLAGGVTNREIAATLHLSERTVAHHVSAILRKLGVSTRLAAARWAADRENMGSPSDAAPPRRS